MKTRGMIIICFIIFLLVFAVKSIITSGIISSDKDCSADSDCRFVATKCCPGCNDYDSVNIAAGIKIEKSLGLKCNYSSCLPFECESSTGQAVTGEPACVSNRCSTKNKVNCPVLCRYLNDSAATDYVLETEKLLGKTAAEISADCSC